MAKSRADNFGAHKGVPPAHDKRVLGGIKSGEVRRQKKTISDTMNAQLNAPLTDEKQLELLKKSGLPITEEPCYKDLIAAQTLMGIIKRGNPDDILKLMEIIGEYKPTQKLEVESNDIKINITDTKEE